MCADVARNETPSADRPLHGRVAVVTGAGRGLGRSIALALAAAGAKVALLGRTAESLQKVARTLCDRGDTALALPTDVTNEGAVLAAAQAVEQTWGSAEILVNNAGTSLVRPFLDSDTQSLRSLFELNVLSAMTCTRIFGAQMVARRFGRVINIASIAGLVGEPSLSGYCASKGALIAWTRALAVEWARYNITVNALAPGYIHTDLNAQALDDPQIGERLLKKIPLRRAGLPDEMGPVLVYLASDHSAFMTGSVLVIDGGQVAR